MVTMARESTFPTDDVPDRSDQVMAVLQKHAPVPVPVTTLYLSIEDKRALAETFGRLEQDGRIERTQVLPEEAHYAQVQALAEAGELGVEGPIRVYRLPGNGPTGG